jgi:serine/threonine protein kinase
MEDAAPVRSGEMLLGKYRVERVLGQGGMGVVVAAKHIQLGELFAIKFLLPAGMANPLAVERFLREARAAARLRGEHVTRVVDVGSLPNGAPYMVMEYLHGDDLRRIARDRGPLPMSVAIDYLLQACDALSEAHAAGIVHRDIKPSNLFLTRRANGTACIKVLDFGISKQLSGDDVELTRTGDLVGSPLYMSPEQLTHARQVDTRSDTWSLGMVLFKLLTGKVPFFGDSLPEIIGRVLQAEAVPPSSLRPDLPPALDAVVGRCLRKLPEQRYARVEDLAADLRAVLAGHASGQEIMLSAVTSGVGPSSFAPPSLPPPPFAPPSLPPGALPADAILRPRSEAPTGSSAWGTTGGRESTASSSSRAVKIVAIALSIMAVASLSAFLTMRFGAPSGPAVVAAGGPSSAGSSTASPTPATAAAAPSDGPSAVPSASVTASAASTASAPASASAAPSGAKTGARSNPFGPPKKHEGIY